jgi:rubrerythrin
LKGEEMRIEEKQGKLVVTDFNEFEAYRIASKIERDGIEFYEKLSNNAGQKELKNALRFLLQEEKKHLKFFEGCLSLLREEKEDISEDEDLLSSMDYGIFKPYQSITELENILKDSRKAIRLGLVIEDRSIEFYKNCEGKISTPVTKKEISRIIEEEKRHKELLENILTNL